MASLSVNLNVAALLRNRRNHPWPDVVELGRTALDAGAAGLTLHPRPDERHAKPDDVYGLRKLITKEFPDRELNIEGYPDARFLGLVKEVGAEQVTLVPDAPGQATSDHGWDFTAHRSLLSEVVEGLKANGHRVSLFADPDARVIPAAAATGADRIELYTGQFGSAHSDAMVETKELEALSQAAQAAVDHGLGVNAGHDLTVPNTARLIQGIPFIAEVSIGHALFCDALTFGLATTVGRYLRSCQTDE